VCARHGVALAAAALQFPARAPGGRERVTGMRHEAEGSRTRALRAPIPAGFWAELKHEGLVAARRPWQRPPDRANDERAR
jgi:D-threo-aldose 1-dehydrogenase